MSRRQVRHRPTLPVCVAEHRGPARGPQTRVTEIYDGRPMMSRASASNAPPRRAVGLVLGPRIVPVSRSRWTVPGCHGGTGLRLVGDRRAVPLPILADAAARRPGPAPPVQPKRRDRRCPGDRIGATLFFRGWRRTSRRWRLNSGTSSSKRIPWCARDPSPGLDTWPPLIRLTSAMLWWGARKGRVMTSAMRAPVRPAMRG